MKNYGAPGRSRTHNLLIRSQTLYPIELRALNILFYKDGAEDRNRTGTVVTYRRILSPVRLPVPPPRHLRKLWSGRRGSNSRPPPWQGGVLPLNYFRNNIGEPGFEPGRDGIKIRCLTAWLYPNKEKFKIWWRGADSNRRTRRNGFTVRRV